MNDLRFALRSLLKSPGFTAAAVVTLGLGIGATTAIFSVLNGVLLRPLPYPEPDRLVRIWASRPDRNLPFFSVSPLDYRDWRAQARSFEALGAFDRQADPVAGRGARRDSPRTCRRAPTSWRATRTRRGTAPRRSRRRSRRSRHC